MKNCLDCATALTDTATSCWACGLEAHDFGHKTDAMFVEVSTSKDEQHELTQGSIKRITLLKTFCYNSLVVLLIAGYFGHLIKQAGKETPIPAVANGVEEFKQQQQPVATDQPEELPVFPSHQGRPSKSDWFQADITMGRSIQLMVVYSDIGIRNARPAEGVESITDKQHEKFLFLKGIIHDKVGKPPLRGSEEEWDRYIDRIYAFDIDEYLA